MTICVHKTILYKNSVLVYFKGVIHKNKIFAFLKFCHSTCLKFLYDFNIWYYFNYEE